MCFEGACGYKGEEYNIIILLRLHSSKLPKSSHFENIFYNVMSIVFGRNISGFFSNNILKQNSISKYTEREYSPSIDKIISNRIWFKNFKICYKFCKSLSNVPFLFSKKKTKNKKPRFSLLKVWFLQHLHWSCLRNLVSHCDPHPRDCGSTSQRCCLEICMLIKAPGLFWHRWSEDHPLRNIILYVPTHKTQLIASQSNHSQSQPLRTITSN